MKKLLFASLLLFSTLSPAFAQIMGIGPHHVFAPPQVEYAGIQCSSNNLQIQSVSCTLNNLANGQIIVVQGWNFNGAASATLTDSNTGTITRVSGPTTLANGYSSYSDVWVVTGLSAGIHTLTVTIDSPPSFAGINALVVNTANVVNPVDGYSAVGNISPSNSPKPCGDITATSADDLLITFANVAGGGTATPDSGLTTVIPNFVAYGHTGLAGTKHAAWTVASNAWECDFLLIRR